MKLGVYDAILHDRPLDQAIEVVAGLGLTGIEINSGGFLPPVHLREIDEIIASPAAAERYLAQFEGTGVEIAGLNCNGNPLHPDPVIGRAHAADVSFWQGIDRLARDSGVKVALELHPQNVVFNPATIRRLVDQGGLTNVGVELDASHLFWQQMDPVAVVRDLGPLVFHAAAKDVRINPAVAIDGVLDNSFRKLRADEPRTNLGGDEWANEWPVNSSWDFVALGRGHDTAYWTEFLRALHEVDP